jgi:surface polysaccharide O-acyltransferase-like enzyme
VVTFQQDIHRLRGVAILFVVATHCVTFFTWAQHPAMLAVAKDLFDDSTVIFIFISGFLFEHTSSRYSYPRFLKTKLLHVLVPYLLLAIPGIVYVLMRAQPATLEHLGLAHASLLERVAYLYVYGGAQINYALWFVPVICIYYLLSPLLVALARQPRGYAVLLVLVPVSVLMHRPSYSHGHNLGLALYFLSAFVLGMFCSARRERIVPWLDRHLGVCLVAAGTVFAAHLLLSHHHGKYMAADELHGVDAEGLVDWIFLQKVLMTLALWALVRRLHVPQLRWLEGLAQVSFSVFFLHVYVIFAVEAVTHFRAQEVSAGAIVLLMALAVGLPWAIAAVIRRAVPQWSRLLIGS